MAEETRQGEDWSAIELDAIIADYFAMLGDELLVVVRKAAKLTTHCQA